MTGIGFLLRATLRRHDLAAEIYPLKGPQKVPLVLSRDEVRRLLAMAANIKVRVMLSLAYGCGLRAGEVVRLRVGDIDSAQNIIRIVQAKGRKDRNVMLPADIFRDHGAAWRSANAGHVSLDQLKVMRAIERCRTAALGGHVARCEDCAHEHIAYNSCRNRHCPKCQAGAARAWLAAREAELLPVGYFHLVFTLPAPIADIAYQNKRENYNLVMGHRRMCI